MRREEFHAISDALGKRNEFLRIVAIAAILALGINLLAYSLSEILDVSHTVMAIVGIVLTCVAILYLLILLFRTRRAINSFVSLVPIDKETNEVIRIPRYELSEQLFRALKGAFVENKALHETWRNQPLVAKSPIPCYSVIGKNKATDQTGQTEGQQDRPSLADYVAVIRATATEPIAESKSAKILHEALEFVLLEQLSLHLSAYFEVELGLDKETVEYTRNDVPDLLLQNRVLSLLSTPIEDRAIFSKCKIPVPPPEGEIVEIYGPDGAVYSHFRLRLPKGTKVSRPSEGILKLENNRISLELIARYEGFLSNMPHDFPILSLTRSFDSVRALRIDVELRTSIKIRALLRPSGWKYHQWIDSFSQCLGQFASFSCFLERIGWETAYTGQLIERNLAQLRQAKRKTGPPGDATAA